MVPWGWGALGYRALAGAGPCLCAAAPFLLSALVFWAPVSGGAWQLSRKPLLLGAGA